MAQQLGIIARAFSLDSDVIGLRVANMSYIRALIQHSTFEQIDFFCFEDEIVALQNVLNLLPEVQNKVLRFFPTHQIANVLANTTYDLLFGLDPEYGKILIFLRNLYAITPCPVFLIIHSMSGGAMPQTIWEIQMNAGPYDTILCSSNAGEEVVLQMMRKNSQSRQVENPFLGKVCVLPLGIRIPHKHEHTRNLRERLDIPANSIVFGVVARIDVMTKMELSATYLAFFELIQKTGRQDLVLVIAGNKKNNNYFNRIQTLGKLLNIHENIRYYCDFTDEERPLLYNTIDVFVSLSDNIQETFGLALVEAMSHSKPVIASDWNGYKDIVVNDITGFLIPTYWMNCFSKNQKDAYFPHQGFGDLEDLYLLQVQTTAVDIPRCVAAMAQLLDAPRRQAMGSAGFERAHDVFAWPRVIEQLNMRYAEIRESAVANALGQNRYNGAYEMFALFGHYPTQELLREHQVQITQFGLAIIQQKVSFLEYVGLWDHIFECDRIWPDLLPRTTQVTPISQLIREFSEYEEETVMINILFCLKFNLLQCL